VASESKQQAMGDGDNTIGNRLKTMVGLLFIYAIIGFALWLFLWKTHFWGRDKLAFQAATLAGLMWGPATILILWTLVLPRRNSTTTSRGYLDRDTNS